MNRDSPKTFPYTKRPPTEQESLAMAIQPGPFIMHEHWPEWKGHREIAMHEAMIILRHRAKFNGNEDKYIVAVAQCIRDSFAPPLDEGTSMHIARKVVSLGTLVGDDA
ncbi:hypothetical protein [Sphingomonas albertensis]|uniref:hypothetical protein n=1 Tax=Sphingomonas albertensis TaxID=2762591 RepID=UPI0037D9D0F8